ncbi:MAG TPA: hypothetical protein DDZ89_09550, partial [Clostridiales bacterium]|nr:hypothetical protein [Clostridiales bacterium]
TQDTFLTAVLKKDSLKNPDSLRAWLDSIARNKTASFYRAKKKEKDNVSLDNEKHPDYPDEKPNPEDRVLMDELQDQLYQCILRLPEHIAYVTILGIVCGLSQKDCSEILNIPVTTVNNRLYKARQLLKRERGFFMERSTELFEKLFSDSRSKVDKVLAYMNEIYRAINEKDFDRAEQILLKAPVLAGDSVEAHLHIAHRCHYINQVEYAWFKRKRERLFILAEQEFKLAEKLDFKGYVDLDTNEDVPKYVHYYFMAEVYVNWGKYDKALEHARIAKELGKQNNFIEGEIFVAQEQYDKAKDFYLQVLKTELSPYDKQMILNRITLCYRKLDHKEKVLEWLLKEYEHLLDRNEITQSGSGFDLGEYEYNIAALYAKNNDPVNMVTYLVKSIRRDPTRIQDIRKKGSVFEPYREFPAFRVLITED